MRLFSSSLRRGDDSLRTSIVCGLLWLISPLGVLADKTSADYFIHDLPGAPDGPLLKMHAGHIEVNPEHHGNLFFWLFQNRHIANKQRTVIWLNGGPGCSSMDGALMEIGPYRVREGDQKGDFKLEYNEGSWDEFANVVFVDQPVGTGFSYVDTDSYDHEMTDIADHMVVFLEKFFGLFPQYMHDDLYFSGESYAGVHIPYIAQAILNRNRRESAENKWNLKGLLIGNGWIAPAEQYLSYLPFAYKEHMVEGGTPVAKRIESQVALCTKLLNEGGADKIENQECEEILRLILDATQLPDTTPGPNGQKGFTCTNMYDIRLRDSAPSCGMNWPPDLKQVTPYLGKPDVVKALNLNPGKRPSWTECSGSVSGELRNKNSEPTIKMLPDILKEVPIVLFSGAKDFICNHIGTEELINNMEWNGGKGFELSPGTWAPRRDWTFEGEPAGIYQEARNLTYVLFYNSSHMVPFDYPRRSRDMLDRFLGVDIASIGGTPADSRIDGEKGLETSVGGHPNSTAAQEKEAQRLEDAKWHAYYKSGEIALVVVGIAAAAWGWYVWRDRRRRAGYRGVGHGNGHVAFENGVGLEGMRQKRGERDVEAADFDEAELDDLHAEEGGYSVGSDEEEEEEEDVEDVEKGKGKGKGLVEK